MPLIGRENLINQLCARSGLQGTQLNAYRASLNMKSDRELDALLTEQLSSNNPEVGDNFSRSGTEQLKPSVDYGNNFSPLSEGYHQISEQQMLDLGEGYYLKVTMYEREKSPQYYYETGVYKKVNGELTSLSVSKSNGRTEIDNHLIKNFGINYNSLIKENLSYNYDKNTFSLGIDTKKNGGTAEVQGAENVEDTEGVESANPTIGTFEIPEGEDWKTTSRRFATLFVKSMFDEIINEFRTIVTQMGALDFGTWREIFGIPVQWISDLIGGEDQGLITATTFKKIERLEQRRDEIVNQLESRIDQPENFAFIFNEIMGGSMGYRDDIFDDLRKMIQENDQVDYETKYQDCVAKFKELYPDNKITKELEGWEDSKEWQQTIDKIGDIVVMILMTEGIGAGVRAVGKEILESIAKKNYKNVLAKFATQFIPAATVSSATMGAWEGSKTFVNGLTNSEELSLDEIISRTIESTWEGVKMGAEMATLEFVAIGPIVKRLSPVMNKMTGATSKVTKMLEDGGGTVSMSDVMQAYSEAASTLRGKLVTEGTHALVATPIMTTAFSITDFNENEYRQALLQQAKTSEEKEEIEKMDTTDLFLSFTKEQFKGLTTIEGVGLLFRRLQAGRIARDAVKPEQANILNAELREKKEGGKTVYEIVGSDGKTLSLNDGKTSKFSFSSIEDATSAYTAMCVTIMSSLRESTENSDIGVSEIMRLVEEGKLLAEIVESLAQGNGNVVLNESFIKDCEKLSKNEKYVKNYKEGTDHSKVLNETPPGEVVEIGQQLYINNNGTLETVNLSKEKYTELFPPGKRFYINQSNSKNAGNCWFLSAGLNIYQNPATRIEILRNFRQEGNDVYVTLPDSKFEYKFENGNLPSSNQVLSNSPLWMNMMEYVGAFTRKMEGVSAEDRIDEREPFVENGNNETGTGKPVFNLTKYAKNNMYFGGLTNLYAGNLEDGFGLFTGETDIEVIDLPETLSKTDRKQQQEKVKETLKKYEGVKDVNINIGLGNHACAISRIEDGKVYIVDPYYGVEEQVYSFDEVAKDCRTLAIRKSGGEGTTTAGKIKASPIEPVAIPIENKNNGTPVRDAYKNNSYPYFKHDELNTYYEFSEESGASTLRKETLPNDQQIIEASQSSPPYGTVAGTSTLDQTIITSELNQCVALAVVDKANNKQSLIHIFPGQSVESNKKIIEYIVSQSKPEDIELSVVSGFTESASSTVQFVLDAVKELLPDTEVNLYNFEKDCGTVILKDGELSCCGGNSVYEARDNIIKNPESNIVYATNSTEIKNESSTANTSAESGIERKQTGENAPAAKIFTQADIDRMRAEGQKISVKEDGSIFRFNPVTKNTEYLGIHADSKSKNVGNPFQSDNEGLKSKNADVFRLREKYSDILSKKASELLVEVGKNKKNEPIYELTEEAKSILKDMAVDIRKLSLENDPEILIIMRELGLISDHSAITDKNGEPLDIAHRAKGIQSTVDKIKNALADNIDGTLEDALDDIRDGVGTRTVNSILENYSEYPDVQKAIKKGDMKEAVNLAIEHESKQVFDALMRYLNSVKDGTNKVEIIRISNYMGKNGIPYFTERQLHLLKVKADELGVNLPIIERPSTPEEIAEAERIKKETGEKKKYTTQTRYSGYTALQINFRVKETGMIYEWQYRNALVNEFAEGEHVPYDLRTGKDVIGGNKKLEPLYKPIKELLSDEKMSDDDYKEYESYLTKYYEYIRMLELGFKDAKKPELPPKFDIRLSGDNLILLHEMTDKVKKTPDKADEYYEEYLNKLKQERF